MFREEKELVVQRVNEYRFYELGQKIAALQGLDHNSEYGKVWFGLWEAREALGKLKNDQLSLRVSLPAVDRLIASITAIVPTDTEEIGRRINQAAGSPAETLGYAYYELSEALRQFEPVLAAECNALDTYVVSQKRGYATTDLVDRSDVMLPIETRSMLDASISADIRAAGRCLAFDTPTAAGFHILRAVEAVMALYYTHVTGRQIKKQHRNWGLYLKRLEKEPRSDQKIRGALDHIKENYRNPITHPDITLTEGEAIMVFGLSLSVMELMAEVMRTMPPALTELEQAKAIAAIAEHNAAANDVDDF